MIFQSSVFTIHGGKLYNNDKPEDRLPDPESLEEADREIVEKQEKASLDIIRFLTIKKKR